MTQPDLPHRIDMVIPSQHHPPHQQFDREFNRSSKHNSPFDCIARLGTLQAAHEFYPTLHEYWATRLSSQYGQE